jgi:hypothetical protein
MELEIKRAALALTSWLFALFMVSGQTKETENTYQIIFNDIIMEHYTSMLEFKERIYANYIKEGKYTKSDIRKMKKIDNARYIFLLDGSFDSKLKDLLISGESNISRSLDSIYKEDDYVYMTKQLNTNSKNSYSKKYLNSKIKIISSTREWDRVSYLHNFSSPVFNKSGNYLLFSWTVTSSGHSYSKLYVYEKVKHTWRRRYVYDI